MKDMRFPCHIRFL